jgi:hypothetical protein
VHTLTLQDVARLVMQARAVEQAEDATITSERSLSSSSGLAPTNIDPPEGGGTTP